jgi:DNA-binding response OmpR family regulator
MVPADGRQPDAAPRDGNNRSTGTRRYCALIADPDRQTRDALRRILNDLTIGVIEVETADQARRCLAVNTIHIALVEVGLPQYGGDRLARELRRAGLEPVLMSGTAFGLARARRTGFLVLRKPFTVVEAIRAIVLVLPEP